MDQTPLKRPQFFFTTAPLPCPYLPDRLERKLVTELSGPNAEALHESLARSGFRRSHSIAYAPSCPGCQACVPVRVAVKNFTRRRTLARIWKNNHDLLAVKVPARATTKQFDLFQRYQQSRHAGSDMALMGFYEYSAMVEDSPIDTFLLEFRDRTGDRRRRQLRGVVLHVQPPAHEIRGERFEAGKVLEPPLDERHFLAAVHALDLEGRLGVQFADGARRHFAPRSSTCSRPITNRPTMCWSSRA